MKKFFTLIFFVALSSRTLFAFSGLGSGTSGDPFQVTTAAQLAEVISSPSSYYKQMNDIDLTSVIWTPIGNNSTKFTGTYDGNYHKITGFSMTSTSSTQGAGLFGYTNGATIQNIGIEGASVTSSLPGTGSGYTGILIGNSLSSTIQRCYATGTCTSNYASVGGLIGTSTSSSIYNSYSTATVTNTASSVLNVCGGLVGAFANTGTMQNCYSTGNVIGNSTAAASSGLGGFIGKLTTGTGTINIQNCYSIGSGTNNGSSTNCGGFAGYYSAGTGTIAISNCFWNSDNFTIATSTSKGTGANTSTMKTLSTYTNASWDFVGDANGSNDYWNIGTGYPYLNWCTAPGTPTIGTATAGDAQASVTFSAPSSNGGNAISGYTVTSNPDGKTGTGTSSPITVTGLTNGTPYTFTVTATNEIGTSIASAASNSVTPQGSQTITFANPGTQFYGPTPTLTATSSSGLTPTFTSSTTGVCTITSGGTLAFVAPGTCTINADQAGNSAYSAATTVTRSFTVNAVVAGAPAIGTATAGNAQASVTFTAPSSNGGSTITGYTVTSNPDGKTGTGSVSPISVLNLTNGTPYTFTVTATNGVGTSAASGASNSVTPSISTGIDDAQLEGVTIYPNPVDDRLYIKGVDAGEIAVYDMGGCKVISAILASTQAVDVSGLAKGVYTVRITTSNGKVEKKLVKK